MHKNSSPYGIKHSTVQKVAVESLTLVNALYSLSLIITTNHAERLREVVRLVLNLTVRR